jgi:hypothetical protein
MNRDKNRGCVGYGSNWMNPRVMAMKRFSFSPIYLKRWPMQKPWPVYTANDGRLRALFRN